MKFSAPAFVVLSTVLRVHGAFYERFEDVPVKKWDFIVVGGMLASSMSRSLPGRSDAHVPLSLKVE
jgi:hypothetical protein